MLYLKPDVPIAYADFGNSVALERDTLVVGALGEGTGSAQGPGAAYVFVRSGTAWIQQQRLALGDGSANLFGYQVALSGDTLAVAAPHQTNDDGGRVHVYVRNQGVWTLQATLKGDNTEPGDRFGWYVALEGDTLVATATGEAGLDNTAPQSGAAYVFTRSGTLWTQTGYLKAPVVQSTTLFGNQVSISGGTIAVGAPAAAPLPGSAYVFTGSATNWTLQKDFAGLDPTDSFGRSVSIDGDTLAVGARLEDGNGSSETDNSVSASGAAYVYHRTGSSWTREAYLKAAVPEADAWFGDRIWVHGDALFVGATFESHLGQAQAGAVHVFWRTASTWQQAEPIFAFNSDAGDRFGLSISYDGVTLAVGAPYEASNDVKNPYDNSAYHAGAVYLYTP